MKKVGTPIEYHISPRNRPLPIGGNQDFHTAMHYVKPGTRFVIGGDAGLLAIAITKEVIGKAIIDPEFSGYVVHRKRKIRMQVGKQRFDVEAVLYGYQASEEAWKPGNQVIRLRFAVQKGIQYAIVYEVEGISWDVHNQQQSVAGNERKAERQAKGFWKTLKSSEQRALIWLAGMIQTKGYKNFLNLAIPEDFGLRYQATQVWLAMTTYEDKEYSHPDVARHCCRYILGVEPLQTEAMQNWLDRRTAQSVMKNISSTPTARNQSIDKFYPLC